MRHEKKKQLREEFRKSFFSRPCGVCNFCGEEIKEEDFDIAYGYWQPVMRPVHKACKKACEEKEARACQEIDEACNDCKFFQRNEYPMRRDKGICRITNLYVDAHPNHAQCCSIFIHRKSKKKLAIGKLNAYVSPKNLKIFSHEK